MPEIPSSGIATHPRPESGRERERERESPARSATTASRMLALDLSDAEPESSRSRHAFLNAALKITAAVRITVSSQSSRGDATSPRAR